MEDKKKIRSIVKDKRNSLSKRAKELMDSIIFNKIVESEVYKAANTIFVYVSFQGEVDTHKLIKYALNDNKRICVPKIISKKDGIRAVEISSFEELKEEAYSILEPQSFDKQIDEKDIDLILMPGVAFDESGGRIGYGGAFYDRFLKNTSLKTLKIALAYDFQIFDKVPMEEHDIKIDGIITN
ncbi:5-formyltetrahydrofolate cyclo-ligase [Clostridium bovifaecis]|uniref:5-formyltetrahydrofolate cyclo-ligase n=1 Tax=Clostridium bovifaecis TaxID=2184719 RepID=A0A6I6FCW6_9CLOT|nr:5-formyltetrahydrofolate cyclo-ligase [Clostridium bovifaecis]